MRSNCGCPSGKPCYPCGKAAARALTVVRAQRLEQHARQMECSTYLCGGCMHWHLSHLSRRKLVNWRRKRRKYGRDTGVGRGGKEDRREAG